MTAAIALETDDGARVCAALTEVRVSVFAEPPRLTVSEWADEYRIVPSYSAEPGRWVTAKTPYLREVMDSFNEPTVNKVVFKKCSRIGATEAGVNIIGYYIHQDPSPIFVVQPTVEDAKDFSKEQLTPSIEETDVLRELVSAASSRESGNTIQAKLFPGGGIYLVGANSPRGFRRRTARLIVLEEVDGYDASAGVEGDQIKLAERRATTFQHRRKIYINSSPTVKGASKIADEHDRSDQRKYFVPCPHCAHEQHLRWEQLKWEDRRPETAQYCCEECGSLIAESEKFRMVQRGQWIPTKPGALVRGYHLNALYSPWVTWVELVIEWQEAQGNPEKLQVFVNTALGEEWEDRGGGLDRESMFLNRRESYNAAVPMDVAVLMAGVDIQHDRIEVIVRGWGQGEESWLVERKILIGDTTADQVWKDLDAFLQRRWRHESGASIAITATCIDAGDQADRVLKFCTPRYRRKVFAVKGGSNPTAPLIPKRASRNNKYRCPLFVLGVNQAKGLIYGRLKIVGTNLETPCAYRYHFAVEHADRDYFEQLTAEKADRKYIGRLWVTVYTCPAHRRNEVLDAELYALAALRLSNVALDKLGALAKKVAESAEKTAGLLVDSTSESPKGDGNPPDEGGSGAVSAQPDPPPEPPPGPPAKVVPPRRLPRGGYVNSWRR